MVWLSVSASLNKMSNGDEELVQLGVTVDQIIRPTPSRIKKLEINLY